MPGRHELNALKRAINETPSSIEKQERWRRIGDLVGSRGRRECYDMYKELKEMKAAKKREAEEAARQSDLAVASPLALSHAEAKLGSGGVPDGEIRLDTGRRCGDGMSRIGHTPPVNGSDVSRRVRHERNADGGSLDDLLALVVRGVGDYLHCQSYAFSAFLDLETKHNKSPGLSRALNHPNSRHPH